MANERTYVFKLIGDAGGLVGAAETGGKALDTLAQRTDAVNTKSAATAAPVRAADQAIRSMGVSAGQTAQAMRQLPAQLTDVVTQLAGGQNPLLVLIQQGGQVKDSFGGFRATFTALSAAINPVTVALGAGAIALAGVGFAAYNSSAQLAEFNKSMVLTGNYAGVTIGQMQTLSRTVATAANTTAGAARDALQAVVSSGVFGPQLLQPVSTAVARLSALTGESADKLVADFARMGDGVAKYAAEHNKSMHLITAAQYEQIKALEEAGKAEQAQAVYIGALNSRLAEHDKSIGALSKAWTATKNAASEYFTWLGNAYTGNTTVDRQLEVERAKLANLEQANKSKGAVGLSGRFSSDIAETQQTIAALERSKALAEQVAKATAESNKRQAEGIAGSQVVDALKKEIDKRSEATKKIQEYTVAVQRMRAANDPKAPSAAEEAADIAAIREKYKTKGDRDAEKLDTRFTDRSVALQQEGVRLDAETRSYELYGRSIDKARLATLNLEIAQGKLKGLDPARIAQLQALAAADDQKDQALDRAKVTAEVSKSIEALRSEANAKSENARESEISRRIAEMEAKGIKVGTEAYIENAAQIRTWVNVKYDQALVRQLADQQRENDSEVAKLEEETRLLSASTVERQRSTVALREQAKAREQIAAGGDEQTVQAAAIARTDALTAAIDRNYEASRRFETGSRSALQKYQEEAGNSAAYAERVIGGGLARTEDAFVEFAKTGKLSFKSLFEFMYEEFARNLARMAIAESTKSGGWLSALGSLFGGLSVDTSGYSANGGTGYSNAAGIAGGKANGGMVAAGSLQPVNELGPELLSTGGKDYLMMGGQGGYVTPVSKRDMGGGGSGKGGGNVYVTNNSRAEVSSATQDDAGNWRLVIDEATRQAENKIASNIRSGSGKVPSALKSRGISLDRSLVRKN